MMGTRQMGMGSPAVSLFDLRKISQRRSFQAYLKHLAFYLAKPQAYPQCLLVLRLHSSSSVLSCLLPSLVHSHCPFHRQSLPDLQQTDNVSR
jgi:hypothetical protein